MFKKVKLKQDYKEHTVMINMPLPISHTVNFNIESFIYIHFVGLTSKFKKKNIFGRRDFKEDQISVLRSSVKCSEFKKCYIYKNRQGLFFKNL